MNEIEKTLARIEEKLDMVIKSLGNDEPETTRHEIKEVTRYISGSGNVTWKAFNQDGDIIYLRQAHKQLLQDAGLWEPLNRMTEDQTLLAYFWVDTVPDGDFMKPVKIDPGGFLSLSGQKTEENITLQTIIESGDYLVVDTETTDLKGYPCQIGILSPTGVTILDTLVKPPVPISRGSIQVHGITNEMVEDKQCIGNLWSLERYIRNAKYIIGWNVGFDRDALLRAAEYHKAGGLVEAIRNAIWFDAMELFSEIYGEWNEYYGNYKWQKLTTAASYYGIETNGAHSAIADCKMTLAVAKEMVKADGND